MSPLYPLWRLYVLVAAKAPTLAPTLKAVAAAAANKQKYKDDNPPAVVTKHDFCPFHLVLHYPMSFARKRLRILQQKLE